MFRLYPILLILQVFCIYHAYSNRAEQKWFWIIIFIPLFGSLFYLYHHFYSRENIATVTEVVKSTVNSNYNIQRLEREVDFSDSIQNKSNLADAYVSVERYKEAIELYESCVNEYSTTTNDVLRKLIYCYYHSSQFEKAVEIGKKIEHEKVFKNTHERIAYAWSLYEVGDLDRAESNFRDMNARYSNYPHRLELGKFLFKIGKTNDSIEVFEDMLSEFDKMTNAELRPHRAEKKEIEAEFFEIRKQL